MKDKKNFIIGLIIGAMLISLIQGIFSFTKKHQKQFLIDKEQSIKENGFCFCKDIQNEITIENTDKISLRNLDDGQSFVDISAIYNIDEQEKLLKELYEKTKFIQNESNDDFNIWTTSDTHGDIVMLMEGLLKSGLIKWDGKTKIGTYNAYKDKNFKVVYPDVKINNKFKGKYINLGDIVNKKAFGMMSLFLLHDIFEKTKNKDGTNDKVKIIIGNHEYADMNMKNFKEYSPYKNTLKKFIDMFIVYYEENGISFTHAPMSEDMKPENDEIIKQLNSSILDDKDYKIQHMLWGAGATTFGYIKSVFKTQSPDKIAPCNVSGHTHGFINFGYNKRADVLNISTDRFNKDETKRGIIFRINTKDKKIYSYTKTKSKDKIIENVLQKNLFFCNK